MDGLNIPDRRIPVPDDELEPWEYEEACEEAKRRNEQAQADEGFRLSVEQPELLECAIDNLSDRERTVLAVLINSTSDGALRIWRERQFRELADVKWVNEEDVLSEWHEARRDDEHQRSVDDRMDHEQENAA